MSISAIVPVTGIDFDASTATASQQTVFSNLLNQLGQAIGAGNLNSSATLFYAIQALSPSAASASSPLGTFLTSLGKALHDGSASEAQGALSAYQSAPSAATAPAAPATSTTAASIAAGLIQSQIQLNLVTSLLGPGSSLGSTSAAAPSSSTPSSSVNSLIGILNEAYGTGNSSSPAASGSTPTSAPPGSAPTPYDTLVSSVQASLAGGHGTITPALAYLQASGNFVNTSA
jgi:hypothetical protein